ncbi:MAG TPA: tetratricopeptide repeat protein, partial [Chitinophagaceae bacterium]|nr:tetratricopeptide repeat protein [Chitinophagaceae bacterium]
MKAKLIRYSLMLLCSFVYFHSFGQFSSEEIIRLKNKLNNTGEDTARINICLEISNDYRYTNIDSSIWYAEKAVEISRSIHNLSAEAAALSQKGFIVLETGDLPQSLQYQFMALDLLQGAADPEAMGFALNRIGNIYMELGDWKKAIDYYRRSETQFRKINKIALIYNELSNIGYVYGMMGMADSAKIYMQQVYVFGLTNTDRYAITYSEMRDRYGFIETRLGNYDSALLHYRIGITEGIKDVDFRNLASIYLHIAQLFFKTHQNDSCFYYARKTIETAKSVSWKRAVYEASDLLAKLF